VPHIQGYYLEKKERAFCVQESHVRILQTGLAVGLYRYLIQHDAFSLWRIKENKETDGRMSFKVDSI